MTHARVRTGMLSRIIGAGGLALLGAILLSVTSVFAQSSTVTLDALYTIPASQVRTDLLLRTTTGERWYDSELRRSLDPVTGLAALLVTQRDISERRNNHAELEAQRARLADQADLLRRLAAPVLRVAADLLDGLARS